MVIDKKEDIVNKVKGLDFALLALHGKFGEDGTVQSVLTDFRYTIFRMWSVKFSFMYG